MLTTKQLLGMTSQDALAAMLNDINPGLNLNGRDVVFGQPEALGATLTQISMAMRRQYSPLDFVPYTGSISFTYNRLDIADFATLAFVDYNPTVPFTTLDLLDELHTLFGCDFDPNDFVIEQITSNNNGQYTLKTQPTSLRWIGTYDLVFGTAAPLLISGTMPNVPLNEDFSYAFTASGGVGPYTWSAQGLPGTFVINQDTGVISGQCSVLGNYPATIVVVDSTGTQQQIGITIHVVRTTTYDKLAIGEAFPSATVGVEYYQTVPITGGSGVYSNPRFIGANIPPGLSLSIVDTDLVLSGTPTATFFGLITPAVDSNDGQTASQVMQFVTLSPMAIVGSYMQAQTNVPFVDALGITGGSGDYFLPYLTDGTELPPGIDTLIINDERLEIRGTPSETGTFPFTVIILTGYGQYLKVTLSLTVVAGTPNYFGDVPVQGNPL